MKKVSKIIYYTDRFGLCFAIKYSMLKMRSFFKAINYSKYQELLRDRSGLEIGGPSRLFVDDGKLPLYSVIKNLDGVNFSENTIWEGSLQEGYNYRFQEGKCGYQYVADAVDLRRLKSNCYDFVLSCNNFEHIANPLKALNEWARLLKPNGILLLVVPNKDFNFDHQREVTSLVHLIEDYKNDTREDDLSHINEILTLHDLVMDTSAGNYEEFKNRCMNNFYNRALHHHVFDMSLLKEIFKQIGFKVILEDNLISDFTIAGTNGD